MRFALFTLAAFLLAACGGPNPQTKTESSLRDVNGQPFSGPRFGVQFPEGWEVRENIAFTNVIAIAPLKDEDPFTESVSVVLENLRSKISARDYLEAGVPVMQKVLRDFEVISKDDTTLPSGLRAALLRYRHTVNQTSVESIALYVVSNNAGYVVTGVADLPDFPNYVETYEGVFRTFELKD